MIVGGTTVSLTAGNGEQSTLLYFLLVPKEALDQPVTATPATVNELYRTAAPLPEPPTQSRQAQPIHHRRP